MAKIKLQVFGGLYPALPARGLPNTGAQTATDIEHTGADFRPVAADTTVIASSGFTNPLTIFRLSITSGGAPNTDTTSLGTWKIFQKDVSMVKMPVNSDVLDRHAYTVNDASEPPRWVDAAGTDRLLGVPRPTTAPTTVLNEVDEFTVEDRGTELNAALETAYAAVIARATLVYRGAPAPSADGYADRTAANGFSPIDPSQQVRCYRLSAAGGVVSDSYVSIDESNFSHVFDPALSPVEGLAIASSPAWALPAGTPHICIPYVAYGQTYDLDGASLTTDLAAILMPGLTDGTKLFTSGQVADIVAELQDFVNPAGARVKPKIDALKSRVVELQALLDGGARASLAAIRQAFYAKTDVAASIAQKKANFAAGVFAMADSVARSSLPNDYNQAGPGNGST